MKAPEIKRFAFLFLLTVCLSDCELVQPVYRDRYLGKWNFTNLYSSSNIPSDGPASYDTVFYTGVVIPGNDYDEVIVHYTQHNSLTLHINKDGVIKDYCLQPSSCSGGFSDEKNFSYTYSARINSRGVTTVYNRKIYGKK